MQFRRDQGIATGPTEAEFRAEGATLLVGMVTPAYPDRLANHIRLTPVDEEYTRFAYLDALPVLTGDLVGALFGRGKTMTPEARAAQLDATRQKEAQRAARRGARRENRTGAAANVLLRWAAKNGIDVVDVWGAGDKGNGFTFRAQDEYTLRNLQEQGRSIARDPRFHSYFTVVPGEDRYLAAFVVEPKLVPIDYFSALSLAESATDPELADLIDLDFSEPDEITIRPIEAESSGFLVGLIGGDEVGNFFKNVFGPKKPEGIEKKIEKLKEQLAYWEGKLAEAKASAPSEGLYLGNIAELFGESAQQSYGHFGASPATFEEEGDFMDFDVDQPELFAESDPGQEELGRVRGPAGRRRRHRRRHRRRERRQDRRQERREEHPNRARRRRRNRGGGGGGGQQQPQVIIIREGGGGGGDNEDYYDDEFDEYDESDGVGTLGTSGGGLPGRVYDLPRSPNGFVTNYPVG